MRRKKPTNDDTNVDESWLLPYSDMLTLLLALFIVLFAMSELDGQKYRELAEVFKGELSGGTGSEDNGGSNIELPIDEDDDEEATDSEEEEEIERMEELKQLQSLKEEINGYIDENSLSEVIGTELTDEGLLITILNDISFDSGSADVKKDGKKVAKEISEFLLTDPPHQIVVSGHADDVPVHNQRYESNWELSVTRAINFMGFILENNQLDPDRFSAKGYGEHHPIVPNTSEENRAKNRRVEVLILPNYNIELDEGDE